jgi:hypothetical protein
MQPLEDLIRKGRSVVTGLNEAADFDDGTRVADVSGGKVP